MYIQKNFGVVNILKFTGRHILLLAIWATLVTCLYELTHWKWLAVPWLPISVIGTAVAFYIGFKNNQAYDRLWEARKIWGAIVNSSRALGSTVLGFTGNNFRDSDLGNEALHEIRQRLIYRHIAWLYALRNQLLIPTTWEHVNQSKSVAKQAKKRQEVFGTGLIKDQVTEKELKYFLPSNEYDRLIDYKNTATQIINEQSLDLAKLRTESTIDDFRHMELQNILNDFYIHQGKCERIKKFPLPRQYGSTSLIFVYIFIFLLPFGIANEFHELNHALVWLSIPFTVLVGWVYLMMELVGDYSENPFEGLGNDIPMLSLCRVIEIDLREMLGETELPPAIEPIDGVLM